MAVVFDFDNHDGALTAYDIVKCKAAGMQGAIVGLQYPGSPYPPGVAHQQLDALITAGVPIYGCYAESQFIGDVWHNVEQYRTKIPIIYVACEEDFVDRAYIDRSLDFADSLNLGARAGIYTGGWWWDSRPDNIKHWFGDRKLWIAQYDGHPDPEVYSKVGDWDYCTIKQYSGTAKVGRLNLDLNVTRDW